MFFQRIPIKGRFYVKCPCCGGVQLHESCIVYSGGHKGWECTECTYCWHNGWIPLKGWIKWWFLWLFKGVRSCEDVNSNGFYLFRKKLYE